MKSIQNDVTVVVNFNEVIQFYLVVLKVPGLNYSDSNITCK